ncbi:MAG: hypothetical protein U9M89_01655 [Patescibacteria group bacterium]|nr:hypothetical protein [Patescibacteria group bacterium]
MRGLPITKYLWGIWFAGILALAALILIIVNFDPYISDWPVFALLFASFFILTGALAVTLVYVVDIKRGAVDYPVLFSESVKLGIISSVAVTAILYLQMLHILTWWNSLIVIFIASILGIFTKQANEGTDTKNLPSRKD